MKAAVCLTALAFLFGVACLRPPVQDFRPLFDGKTFNGWEGDTGTMWRIEDGVLIGGSLEERVPRNNFLVTVDTFSNFHLKMKVKLIGTEGFINSGIQFHSVRIDNPPNEMRGYQADLGDRFWGSLYDESRRNRTIAIIDSARAHEIAKRNDWNDFEVVAKRNGNIRVFLNGEKTVDYIEQDPSIPQSGHIGIQIHGGGKAEIHVKEMLIKPLAD